MIVKLQRPLGFRARNTLPWLVYAQGRAHMQRVVVPRRLREDFGDDMKRFYEADLINGRFTLIRQVEDQPW